MASHRLAAGVLALAAAAGCRLDRIPPGASVDTDAIRGLITGFHQSLAAADFPAFQAVFDPEATIVWRDGRPQSTGGFWEDFQAWLGQAPSATIDARPVRLEIRHRGDAATAWLTSSWTVTRLNESPKTLEHRAVFLLRRRGARWLVVSLLLLRQSPPSS